MPPRRFIQYGLGPIGSGIAELALQRGHRLVAAVDVDPTKAGRPAADLIPGAPRDIGVVADAAGVLNAGAEVVLHSTQSRLAQILPQLTPLLDAGLRVISTCEELAFPWHHHPAEAHRLHDLARARGAAVVGLGVNPGFVMDLLPVVLTAPCRAVRSVTVERRVDVGRRRLPLQQKVGVGLRPDEWQRGVQEGRFGHVGLPQSVAMIAYALGWSVERIHETIEPIVDDVGGIRGLHQVCRGTRDGAVAITLDLTMAAGAEHPRDAVIVEGDPSIRAEIAGGIHGDVATWAIVVNAIPRILAAPPGLLLATQLPTLGFTSY